MDLFEYNKIAGAVLFALLIIIGAQNLADILYAPTPASEEAYIVEGLPEAGAIAGTGEAEGPSLAMQLAEADSAAGQKVAKKCVSCHTFTEGGANGIGPNLWNIVNRSKAAEPGFTYSSALQAAEGAWTYEDLDGFLTKPKTWLPGTNMAFAGLRKPEQRADAIVYLRSLSAAPPPLPLVETSAEQAEDEELGEPVVEY